MDLVVNFTESQRVTLDNCVGDANETWTLIFPDSSTYATDGYVNKLGAGTAGPNEKITCSVGLKCSGKPTFTSNA